MANNDLAIRFTETKYATRLEVAKELKMSLIDSIWSSILSYRSGFNRYLSIKSIEKNQLVVCFCPSINASVNVVDMKIIRLMKEFSQLNGFSANAKRFEEELLVKNLGNLSKKHELDVSEQYLRSVVRGDIRDSSPSVRLLPRYLDALRFIKLNYSKEIDVDFLAELYSRLLGTNELTSFYRSKEDVNRENRVLIDRIYTCAPVSFIESMMDSLFMFLASTTLSAATKASIAYYYINYIRPFSEYSDEIALLIAKAILAHDNMGEMGALLPIESLLAENQEEIARLFTEVQKTNDTTYFLVFALKQFESKCDESLDVLTKIKNDEIKRDFYRADENAGAETTTYTTVKQQSLFDHVQEEPEPVKPIETPKVVKEEYRPIREEPKVQEQPKVEPVQTQPKVVEQKVEQPQQEQLAVAYIPPALDEKQALRLEQHLLELDPSLRKHEAHFYARHCTLGKSYTIAQYKRMIGCVYETARTAMDHLVELGYYRKDSSNKKFIYTPIPKK